MMLKSSILQKPKQEPVEKSARASKIPPLPCEPLPNCSLVMAFHFLTVIRTKAGSSELKMIVGGAAYYGKSKSKFWTTLPVTMVWSQNKKASTFQTGG